MKSRLSILALLVLLIAVGAAPAFAGSVLYDNGPYNGTIDAWTIDYGYWVSDSFSVAGGGTATGANFVLWMGNPGDTLTSVDWAIGSTPGATNLAAGTANAALLTDLGLNGRDYDMRSYGISFPDVTLAAGSTYWFTLQNAVVSGGDIIFWDQNNGPSLGWQSTSGPIGSHAFQIAGTAGSPIPEPSTLGLLGLGLTGLLAFFRRKTSR